MVPIISKTSQLPIGQLTIDYLSIQTMSVSVDVQLTMETSFSRYWRKRPTVEIGHRGYGVSTTKLSNVRENTIHSLNYAAENGADYVEFDVQLTKDRVPIIFHDFHLLVKVAKRSTSNGLNANSNQLNPKKNNINASDFHEISVQDLKIEQLHLLHVEHYQAQMPDHSDKLPLITTDDESPDLRPFPTLVEGIDINYRLLKFD
jgi:glycerophosphoryl diester phosphodiesterase